MEKTRVLVVDDSVLMRSAISHVIASDPELEVVGVAPNGRIALAKMEQVQPDIVTLDFEMPEMGGLETLGELQKRYPSVPVIMLSSLTLSGAAETLEALARGAVDYVGKPQGGDPAHSLEVLGLQLLPLIKIHSARAKTKDSEAVARREKRAMPTAAAMPAVRPRAAGFAGESGKVSAVCIGTSTGGPNALAELFAALPGDLPVPLLIVQHMPPMFTRLLAERLAATTKLRVTEAQQGMRVSPGEAYIAPGGLHMEVRRDTGGEFLHLQEDPPENSCRPAADVLFRSAAAVYGKGVLAVVMTGMGQDGKRGCEAIHNAGGYVIVQDEASSVVWGMPRAVAESGLANLVKPLCELGPELVMRLRGKRPAAP
ncbi:MAG: chemotaxis response regulator protein-glutamate methylesterase [Acidobacteriota bacterium]